MFDLELAIGQLSNVEVACGRILSRIKQVSDPEDLVTSEEGHTILDAIGMALIGIGEEIKKLETHAPAELLAQHPEVNWKAVKATRDRLSHGYFFLNNRIIYTTATQDIPVLLAAVTALRAKLEAQIGHS